jgi:hypothetical protein
MSMSLCKLRRPGERMQSLFDVFAAIAADEGDHVSAMSACQDSDATFQSPSIERRILVGVAALAVSTYLMSSTGVFDASLVDTADTAVSVSTDSTVLSEVTAAAAGMMGWANQMLREDEGNIKAVGEGMVEGNEVMPDLLRRIGSVIFRFFSRLL